MTYIKINDTMFPASVRPYDHDRSWDYRDSKAITLEMSYDDAVALFVDGLEWSTVYQNDTRVYIDGELTTMEPKVTDNSEFCVAGSITDNRDGTVTVKMGKITAEEVLVELMEVLA